MSFPADAVLWQEQVESPSLGDPARPLGDDGRVDVLVVGGGYAGLAAAIEVARAGRRVLVVEKGEIGWGAHRRNGGMAIPELKAGPATLEARYGELGRRMHAEVNEAFDHLEARIADEAIDCDYRRSGQLYLAHAARVVPHLQHLALEHAEAGEPVRFVAREELGAEIGSEAFHGGVVFERTGGLQPAKLHDGLLRAALAAGASVRDRCAARAIDDSTAPSGRFRVETDAGPVVADHVIVATNAYADRLLPELQRRVLPIGSFIVATEPLDPEVAAAVSRGAGCS
ncbi:MAG: FAD-binding oxidoreductase [Acidimicrobiales bacterium]